MKGRKNTEIFLLPSLPVEKTVPFLLFYPGEGPLSSGKKNTEDFNKLLNTDALIALRKHFQSL